MDNFRVTYTRWLATHSRDHRSYQIRKRYNWGLLSNIKFDPTNISWEQEIRVQDRLIGNVRFLGCDQDNDRHVYHFSVYDIGRATESEYKTVFTQDGLLVTIFQINDPIEQLTNAFISNNMKMMDRINFKIDSKLGKDILVELMAHLLHKNHMELEKYRAFDKIEPDHEAMNYLIPGKKIKNKYIPDFSNGRNHWLLVHIKEGTALSEGLNARTQCKKVTSLYLIGNMKKNHQLPSNMEVNSIHKYFPYHFLAPYLQRFQILKKIGGTSRRTLQ